MAQAEGDLLDNSGVSDFGALYGAWWWTAKSLNRLANN